VYQISSKSGNFSLRYGDLTIFKMAAVRHVGFYTFAFLSACRSTSSYKISLKSDNLLMSNGQKRRFSRWRPLPSWISKISIFGHVTVTGFNIWCSVPNLIKIGRFFTEIWRYNDFQNGGRPPSWILKMCSFCHAAFVGVPFWFRIQNFAEIGKSVDKLWPKKRFLRWRSPPS